MGIKSVTERRAVVVVNRYLNENGQMTMSLIVKCTRKKGKNANYLQN